MVSFFKLLFMLIEAVPLVRDSFYRALDSYLIRKTELASQGRIDAYKRLSEAVNPSEALDALSDIIRNRPL